MSVVTISVVECQWHRLGVVNVTSSFESIFDGEIIAGIKIKGHIVCHVNYVIKASIKAKRGRKVIMITYLLQKTHGQ